MIMNFAVHLDLGCSNETGIPEEVERYFEASVTVLREYIGDKYGWIPPMGHDHGRQPMIAPLYSTLKISLCMMDIFNLSTNLFTNVLALVLQIYRRNNLYRKNPTQCLISTFLSLNILLSLVKAPILYYRISKSGDFSWLSCHLHYFAMAYSRLLVPWLFTAIALNGYLQLGRRHCYLVTVVSICILAIIFSVFMIPEALAAEETVDIPMGHIKSISGTLEALWFEDEEPEEEITIIRHSQCVLEYSVNLIPDVTLTFILPLLIVTVISFKIWKNFYKNTDNFDGNRGRYLQMVWIQPLLIILTFLFNLNYYRWYDQQVNYDVILSEIVDFLPYFGFVFYWLPVICCSTNLHEIETQRNRVKVSTSTQIELSSRPAVTISQPDDVYRRSRTYSINRF